MKPLPVRTCRLHRACRLLDPQYRNGAVRPTVRKHWSARTPIPTPRRRPTADAKYQTEPAAATPDDPYLWLEDTHGERAMDWVKAQNAMTDEAICVVGRVRQDPR